MINNKIELRIKPTRFETMYNISFWKIARTRNKIKPDQTNKTSESSGRFGFIPKITEIEVGIVAEWISTAPTQPEISAIFFCIFLFIMNILQQSTENSTIIFNYFISCWFITKYFFTFFSFLPFQNKICAKRCKWLIYKEFLGRAGGLCKHRRPLKPFVYKGFRPSPLLWVQKQPKQ